jgi:hypothetical protein
VRVGLVPLFGYSRVVVVAVIAIVAIVVVVV